MGHGNNRTLFYSNQPETTWIWDKGNNKTLFYSNPCTQKSLNTLQKTKKKVEVLNERCGFGIRFTLVFTFYKPNGNLFNKFDDDTSVIG